MNRDNWLISPKIKIPDEGTVITANNTRVIDMSKLSIGVYFVSVVTDKGTAIKKVVKR